MYPQGEITRLRRIKPSFVRLLINALCGQVKYYFTYPVTQFIRHVKAASQRVSTFQIPFFQFLRSRAEWAELIDGCARRRKGERLKLFFEHFVEVLSGGDACADVRIVIRA